MRKPLLFLAAVLLAIALHAKPNIIFILADDLGYGDTGFSFQSERKAGEARISTPNLDRLAAEGVVLTDHYCAAPVCAPSRASILTGRLQGKCSVKNNMFDSPILEKDTLGTVMKSAGYRTMAIGKWGVGGGGESGKPVAAHPLDKGFDSFYGFMDHMAGHTYYHYEGFIRGAYMGIWENRKKATSGAKGIYSTDLFTARAKKEISEAVKDHPGEPFFLYLAVNAVHGSGQSDATLKNKHHLHVPGRPYPKEGVSWPLKPEPLAKRNTWLDPRTAGFKNENMRRYATAIERLDDAVGDLVNHLEKLGIAGDTVIVFTSDNGPADEYGADTRFFGSAGPFDGMKRDVYEGGMRVPAFVWRKGGFGVKTDFEPSISTDWMATFAELAGAEKPAACDGVSLLPRWTAEGKGEKSIIETVYEGVRVNEADFRAFANRKGDLVRGAQRMKRTGDTVKLQAGGADKPWRRYDVKADPHEDNDLAAMKIDFTVGKDGTVKDALAAAVARADKSKRFTVFFPEGEYDISASLGDENGKSVWTESNVAFVGESMEGTVLFNKSKNEGIGITATLSLRASDILLRDLTILNKSGYGLEVPPGGAGRHVAVQQEGDRYVYRNVRLLAGQDTYYTRTGGTMGRTWWFGGEIHGTVDFICGDGDVYFEGVKLVMGRKGGYITAASTSRTVKWGYVFKDCTVESSDPAFGGTFMLGRSWRDAKTVFIDTVFRSLPKPEAWGKDMNSTPVVYGEAGSVDAKGRPIDTSGRKTEFSGGRDGSTSTHKTVWTKEEAAAYTREAVLGGDDGWRPELVLEGR